MDALSVGESFKAIVKRVLGGYPGFSLWLNRETETRRGEGCVLDDTAPQCQEPGFDPGYPHFQTVPATLLRECV